MSYRVFSYLDNLHVSSSGTKANSISAVFSADSTDFNVLNQTTQLKERWEDNLDASLLRKIGISVTNIRSVYCHFCKCWLPERSICKMRTVHNINIHISGRKHSKMPYNFGDSEYFGDVPDMQVNHGHIENLAHPFFNPPSNKITIYKEEVEAFIKKMCEQYQIKREYIIFTNSKQYVCDLCKCYLPIRSLDYQNQFLSHFHGDKHRQNLEEINKNYEDEIISKKNDDLFALIKRICKRYQINRDYIVFVSGNDYICSLCKSRFSLSSVAKSCKRALRSHFCGTKHKSNMAIANGQNSVGCEPPNLCVPNDDYPKSEFQRKCKEDTLDVIKEICRQYQVDYMNISCISGNMYKCRICDCYLDLPYDYCRNKLTEHLCGIVHRRKTGAIPIETKDHQDTYSIHPKNHSFQWGYKDSEEPRNVLMKGGRIPYSNALNVKVKKLLDDAFLMCVPYSLHCNKKFIRATFTYSGQWTYSYTSTYCTLCGMTLRFAPFNLFCLGRRFFDHFVGVTHSNNVIKHYSWPNLNSTKLGSGSVDVKPNNYKSTVLFNIFFDLPDEVIFFCINNFVEFTCNDDDSCRVVKCIPCYLFFEVDNNMKSFKNTDLYNHILDCPATEKSVRNSELSICKN